MGKIKSPVENVYHDWSDDTVDWKGINNAADFIGDNLRKYLRMDVRDIKEKYGTVRVYCSMGWYSLHSITHPGHAFIRFKKDGLLWRINYHPITYRLFRLLNIVVVPIHIFAYRQFYRMAVKRWPHLRNEILCAADWDEYLKGL